MFELGNVTTYQAAVYQARAHRYLKDVQNKILKNHGLTMMQWVVLGLVHDAGKSGIRVSDLAAALDTTQAFITGIVNSLDAKGYISRVQSTSDNRSRLVVLVPKYKRTVRKIETNVRTAMQAKMYDKATPEELQIYLSVLEKFAKDS